MNTIKAWRVKGQKAGQMVYTGNWKDKESALSELHKKEIDSIYPADDETFYYFESGLAKYKA